MDEALTVQICGRLSLRHFFSVATRAKKGFEYDQSAQRQLTRATVPLVAPIPVFTRTCRSNMRCRCDGPQESLKVPCNTAPKGSM